MTYTLSDTYIYNHFYSPNLFRNASASADISSEGGAGQKEAGAGCGDLSFSEEVQQCGAPGTFTWPGARCGSAP